MNYIDDGAYEYIYSAFITLKTGRKIYAPQYGLKAFRFRVKRKF